MPNLMSVTDNDQVINLPGPGNFQFSAVRIKNLGATEYTLVTIVCDISGSVQPFSNELENCIKMIIEACKKSPRAENLLIRLLHFNSDIYEIHGFKKLSEIDLNDYKPLAPDLMTALVDATYDAIGATLEYAGRLIDQEFDCNGAVYIITDGCDNKSKMVPSMIKNKIEETLAKEDIESLVSILIGINDPKQKWAKEVKKALDEFFIESGLTKFINAGDATPQKLAKVANWVSESVSSQSQALGTGVASQPLTF